MNSPIRPTGLIVPMSLSAVVSVCHVDLPNMDVHIVTRVDSGIAVAFDVWSALVPML